MEEVQMMKFMQGNFEIKMPNLTNLVMSLLWTGWTTPCHQVAVHSGASTPLFQISKLGAMRQVLISERPSLFR